MSRAHVINLIMVANSARKLIMSDVSGVTWFMSGVVSDHLLCYVYIKISGVVLYQLYSDQRLSHP